MADDRIQLQHEIDYGPSLKGAKELESTLVNTHRSIDSAIKTTSDGLKRSGSDIAVIVDAVLEVPQALESLKSVAGQAFGGNVFGIVSAVGIATTAFVALGKVFNSETGPSRELEEFTKKTVASMDRVKQLRHETERLREELAKARGGDRLADDLKKARLEADAAERAVREFQKAIAEARRSDTMIPNPLDPKREIFPGATGDTLSALGKRAASAREAALSLERNLGLRTDNVDTQINRVLDIRERILKAPAVTSGFDRFRVELEAAAQDLEKFDKASGKVVNRFVRLGVNEFFDKQTQSFKAQREALEFQLGVLDRIDPAERERLLIARATAEAIRRTAVPESASDKLREEAENLRGVIRALGDERGRDLDRRITESLQVTRLRRSLGPQISSFFADATIAGFERGFDGVKDVFQRFSRRILDQLLNLGFAALTHAALPSLFPQNVRFFAHGGIIDRPTLAMMGERGPEEVRPLGSSSLAQQIVEALVQSGVAGGGGDRRILFDPVPAVAVGARGNQPIFREITRSETLRPTTRSMALHQRRRRF